MSEVIIRDKTEYHARTSEQMERHLPLPQWSLRQKIALTCRILAAEGHESALAGQITARGDRPGTYWMLSFGLGFEEARASNIVLVDDDLNLIEGDGMVNPSNRFHLWIYRHRPDVTAIVHTHPPYCSALSLTGQPLVAAHMDTAMFYDDCAYLAEWPGPPIGDEEGRIIHEALGDKRAILLAHHGQLVATSTIEEAAILAVFIERAARMQVLAQSILPSPARRMTIGSSRARLLRHSTTSLAVRSSWSRMCWISRYINCGIYRIDWTCYRGHCDRPQLAPESGTTTSAK
jgi:L-fuculose-phosphate aldolase